MIIEWFFRAFCFGVQYLKKMWMCRFFRQRLDQLKAKICKAIAIIFLRIFTSTNASSTTIEIKLVFKQNLLLSRVSNSSYSPKYIFFFVFKKVELLTPSLTNHQSINEWINQNTWLMKNIHFTQNSVPQKNSKKCQTKIIKKPSPLTKCHITKCSLLLNK